MYSPFLISSSKLLPFPGYRETFRPQWPGLRCPVQKQTLPTQVLDEMRDWQAVAEPRVTGFRIQPFSRQKTSVSQHAMSSQNPEFFRKHAGRRAPRSVSSPRLVVFVQSPGSGLLAEFLLVSVTSRNCPCPLLARSVTLLLSCAPCRENCLRNHGDQIQLLSKGALPNCYERKRDHSIHQRIPARR